VTATRPLLRRDERRASILYGAAAAFADAGFAATSMESIAASAGVSKLIVYRHFDSKEELYRSVIERVAVRLADAFAEAIAQGDPAEAPARAFLSVAREDPEGFGLLWRHSAREPQFAEHVERFRALAVSYARSRLSPLLADESLHGWAAETIVDVLVASILHWLDHDDGLRDDAFVERAGRSLRALVEAWSG
jgi:AcrR family transcriptional regulator